MVIQFHPGSNSSLAGPAPSLYPEPIASSTILADTTAATNKVMTTTTQTTHFFSLPLWRKRGSPVSTSLPDSMSGLDADENGMVRPPPRSSMFMVEKDLPPTPPPEPFLTPCDVTPEKAVIPPIQVTLPTPEVITHPEQMSNTRQPVRSGTALSQPAVALAHAALRLGLPYVMPHASSSSEVNSVAFVPSIPQPQDLCLPISHARRAGGSRVLGPASSGETPGINGQASYSRERRRARGISLGGAGLFQFATEGKEKTKALDTSNPVPKVLSRRPSFWSRRRTAHSTEVSLVLPSLAVSDVPQTSLSLPPISPLNIEQTSHASSQPSPSNENHSPLCRGLSRSHSERTSLRRPSGGSKDEIPPVPSVKPRRPSTADSFGMSRARSFLLDGSHSETLPLRPPLRYQETFQPPLSNIPSQCRPRAHTNPPLLHRLSASIFSSSPYSSTSNINNNYVSSPTASIDSPRTSLHNLPAKLLKPQSDEESPEVYLNRLSAAVSKADVAAVLASSGDPFYVRTLRAYIENFDFVDDPLDVALRKLLMDVGLPRETQQIDRVMEAFASRYLQCNPNLFTSDDHPYILAFSLIMLHTDAFNKSNKRKMTKADYVKNTRLPGVAPEVLECFYDNIVFAPFIFIEDPLDGSVQRISIPEAPSTRTLSVHSNQIASPNPMILGKGGKVDPYYLITQNMLGPLRVNADAYIPPDNPYSYEGSAGSWDDQELQRAFAKANEIVVEQDSPRHSPFFSLSVGGTPLSAGNPDATSPPAVWTIKVTKVGLLNRKDDLLEGGRKAPNRKWKPWSVILTGSQLLLFRDPALATNLLAQSNSPNVQALVTQSSAFRPDESLSVGESVAVFDTSYAKYDNTLRFVMPDGRQFLFQAPDSRELNEWMSRINYASAFKSAGVCIRALGMSSKDVELTGVAAATSHLHDIQNRCQLPTVRNWDGDAPNDLMEMLSGSSPERPTVARRATMLTDMESEVIVAPTVEGADEFKATFDQVKADLAAGYWFSEISPSLEVQNRTDSPESIATPTFGSSDSDRSGLPSRTQIIQAKVNDLETKIAVAESQLESELRFVRNIATLTPFQRSTRDRLQNAVQNVAGKIMQVRIEVTKLICHRDVLSNDLAAEGRNWHRKKQLALRAATETLRIPQMTLSFHKGNDERRILSRRPVTEDTEDVSNRPESSVAESFHSALDFGPEWPTSPEAMGSSNFLSASGLCESPTRRSSGSSSSFPFPDVDTRATSSMPARRRGVESSRIGDGRPGHERFYTAQEGSEEQAEDWNKTRCAHRVSLVRLPSNFRLSSFIEKHARYEIGDQQGPSKDIVPIS